MRLGRRFYIALVLIVLLMGIGYVFAPFFAIGQWALFVLAVSALVDGVMLYRIRGIRAFRQCATRFSNGDENTVNIRVESSYPHPVAVEVVDEIPFAFQLRNIDFRMRLQANEGRTITYHLRPTRRGIYSFGRIRVFVAGRMGLLSRRYTCDAPLDVKVYPSYLMLHRYELLAISDNLTELGIKRIRRVGHHTEFEQIKEYVKGDDYRTINWKASARRHELMVNVYQDERSQQIYNVIDKGRIMQQAFRGMTLLDYAINASLVLSYVVMRKEDKAGLVTFNEHFDTFIPASPTARTNAGVIGEPLQPADYFWGDRLFLIVRTFEQARQQTQSFGAVYQFFRHRQLESPVGLFAAVEPPAPVAGHLLRRCRSERVRRHSCEGYGRVLPPCHCREICIRETADSLHLEAARHQFCADYTGKSFCGRDKQVSGDEVT